MRDGEVKRFIASLNRVDAWVATMVRGLPEWKMNGDQQQKLYTDTPGMMLELAKACLTGTMRVFVQYWAAGEEASAAGGEVTHVVEVPSTMEKYLCMGCRRFEQYLSNELGAVRDCYVARLEIEVEPELLGKPMIELRGRRSAE